MKKRVLLLISLILLIVALFVLCAQWLLISPTRPSFIPAKDVTAPSSYDQVSYPYYGPSPFEGGKMWVSFEASNDFHACLFDLEKQLVLGEVVNAAPVLFNHDQTKILCSQRTPPGTNRVLRLITRLARLAISKGKASPDDDDQETFWVIDLKRNHATEIGHLFLWKGAISSFYPSPDFHHGFLKTVGVNLPEMFVYDLEDETFERLSVTGSPCGWWDEHHIMLQATNNDLELYDIKARKSSTFLSLRQVRKFCADSGLTNHPGPRFSFYVWDGQDNEFYLSGGDSRFTTPDSFLIHLERPDGNLKLLVKNFECAWCDHFDAGAKLYLYSSPQAGVNTSAVYLRDLKTGLARELVPPDQNHTYDFSLPRFYGGGVIYSRSNALWEIQLDGSNNKRLFPPIDDHGSIGK